MTFAELAIICGTGAMRNQDAESAEKPVLVPETGIEPVRPLSGKRRILSPSCNSIKSTTCALFSFRKNGNMTASKASVCAGGIYFAEQNLGRENG